MMQNNKNSKPAKSAKPKSAKPAKPARPSFQRSHEPSDIELYFDIRDAGYWFKLAGRYVKLGGAELDDEFRALGLRDDGDKVKGLDELRWVKHNARHTRQIEYAGPLAGYRKGLHRDDSGRCYLITDEAAGVWDIEIPRGGVQRPQWIGAFMDELLPGDQSKLLSYWLSFALQSLSARDFAPGQAVILAGESNCGKSLMQWIITRTLGGRCADPMEYLTGKTNFNKKMTEAEHWQIEDLQSSTDGKARRAFGENLKRCVINERFTVHVKGKDSLDLPLFRRNTISINREIENLGKLPPLDDSIGEKLFLFDCAMVNDALAEFRLANQTMELIPGSQNFGKPDRKLIRNRIESEMPQFRQWLLTLPALPALLSDSRMGVKFWHHPDLFADLSSIDPWERLLQIIDALHFNGEGPFSAFRGRALQLEQELRDSKYGFEVDKLLKGGGSCGSHLKRLSVLRPDRVSKSGVLDGNTQWTVKPPSKKD